ncbi:MAG: M3 family metallopeptidase [Gammaproteobacteria bacterium]|nr:M3 family metallopeptidase [Gammaproteobacteria bacterium]
MTNNPLLTDQPLPRFSQIQPEHVEPALNQVLTDNRESLETLLSNMRNESPNFENAILPLEELGDRLGRVWGPVSHLHSVKNTPELRDAYNQCLPALSRYQTEMAQNTELCALYQQVADHLGDDEAARSLVQNTLRDFRLSGVDLPEDKKSRFKALIEQLTQLGAKFEQNILDSMSGWSLLETDLDNLAGLPATVLEQASKNASDAGEEGWRFELDQPTYISFITHAENRSLRQKFYRAWVTRASDCADDPQFDNTQVINQILKLRHEAADLIGFHHYAEYSLASKMADSVEEVQEFLGQLGVQTKAHAEEELAQLEAFAGNTLEAWDIAFWSEKLREERYSVSDEQLRPYFPADRVFKGLCDVAHKLYGINLNYREEVDTWHPEVRFYELSQDDGTIIGGFYTDLYARQHKRSGAWMDECVCRKNIDGTLVTPVAHLVCNFAAPTENTPSLLTHSDVVTLFHEFGHTLHHLLTRIDYPSVAGINGVPWDAVELPSQFMENFAWEPEVLRLLSGHYQTDEPLPDMLIDKLQSSRIFQAGLQMLRQLEFALFDLALHAKQGEESTDVYAVLAEVRQRVAVIKQPEWNRFAHSFSHIFGGGYAAGYYSYKWAEVLAADAWSAFAESGIFDAEVANRFRQEILEIGGTRKISAAFEAFRGRPPHVEPLLIQSGIAVQVTS